MKKLIGNINVGVFISGRGSNLKELVKYSRKNNTNWEIKLVISNKKGAKGLAYAKKNKIINYTIEKMRPEFEKKALSYLKKNNINLLCLAGFMRILSKKFIKNCKFKIINIHPSLLPKYKGLNTHERAIKAGDKYTGSTVHYVTTKLDSGKKILQARVRILKTDKPNALAKKVLKAEHRIYPKAVDIACNKII
ncbi:MAG: phosphoribosylglycinamide formyltransferase [Pelagibacteraceae bacterium]|nr:MAG: phosphoribosylglycinamide formyltransferase [Pelagibacteraceae bacterium]